MAAPRRPHDLRRVLTEELFALLRPRLAAAPGQGDGDRDRRRRRVLDPYARVDPEAVRAEAEDKRDAQPRRLAREHEFAGLPAAVEGERLRVEGHRHGSGPGRRRRSLPATLSCGAWSAWRRETCGAWRRDNQSRWSELVQDDQGLLTPIFQRPFLKLAALT